MIYFALPSLTKMPFRRAAAVVGEHFMNWEILGEEQLSLELIKDEFADVVSSYDFRIQLHAPFSDLNLASSRERTRRVAVDILCETIDTAADLGIEHVTVHPGLFSPQTYGERERILSLTNTSLKELDVVAQNRGIPLSLENMPFLGVTVGHTPEEIMRMIEGTELSVCLDIGHANTTGNVDAFLDLLPYVRNVHIHDNHGGRDEHLTLGHGNIDLPPVLKRLKDEYNGPIVVEAETGVESGLESMSFLRSHGIE